MFKNILRTFETEILKKFKNIQPQPKIRRSYVRKELVVGFVWMENKN